MKPFSPSLLMLALLSSLSAYAAPVAPDAGQTIRELQNQPVFTPPAKAATPLQLEAESKRTAGGDAVRIEVKAVRVTGNRVATTAELETLVADLVGERSLAELDAGAARITAWYRQRGYAVARAYLPAQEIKDGVVVVNVLEGVLGQARVVNQSRLSDDRANAYLGMLSAGDAVQEKSVNRALLLLNDVSGVGGARATLQPGASVGTSDLIVQLDPSAPYSGSVELDNYGNRYTGENRLGGELTLNSPLQLGDQLSLRALTSNQDMQYVRVAYQLPVGGNGLKLGVGYSDTRYYLGKEFAILQAHGTASNTSLFATYPIIRSPATNLHATLTWERKALVDQIDVLIDRTDRQVQLFNLGMVGKQQDARGISLLDLALVSGNLSMDAATLATDALTAGSNGAFTRLRYSLIRVQKLTEKVGASLLFSGQQSNMNLNSSEKFALGGANGVRAYPQGEGAGDQGWMANMEVRRYFNNNTVQGIAFYDMGAVQLNRNPFNTAANNRNIAGVGFGLNAETGALKFKTYVAWRTQGGQALTESAAASRNPRIWLQMSGAF
ncbi:MAG: ShlB/FhaC/HecB family hemolysin secretion/activation protein [Gallionella sp.]